MLSKLLTYTRTHNYFFTQNITYTLRLLNTIFVLSFRNTYIYFFVYVRAFHICYTSTIMLVLLPCPCLCLRTLYPDSQILTKFCKLKTAYYTRNSFACFLLCAKIQNDNTIFIVPVLRLYSHYINNIFTIRNVSISDVPQTRKTQTRFFYILKIQIFVF